MKYSAFEQAAAEATVGMKEVETRLEQMMGEMEQLKGKRELLRSLTQQLNILRSEGMNGAPVDGAKAAVEAPKPELTVSEPEMAAAPAATSSTRGGWFTRASDSGAPGDSSIRGRL